MVPLKELIKPDIKRRIDTLEDKLVFIEDEPVARYIKSLRNVEKKIQELKLVASVLENDIPRLERVADLAEYLEKKAEERLEELKNYDIILQALLAEGDIQSALAVEKLRADIEYTVAMGEMRKAILKKPGSSCDNFSDGVRRSLCKLISASEIVPSVYMLYTQLILRTNKEAREKLKEQVRAYGTANIDYIISFMMKVNDFEPKEREAIELTFPLLVPMSLQKITDIANEKHVINSPIGKYILSKLGLSKDILEGILGLPLISYLFPSSKLYAKPSLAVYDATAVSPKMVESMKRRVQIAPAALEAISEELDRYTKMTGPVRGAVEDFLLAYYTTLYGLDANREGTIEEIKNSECPYLLFTNMPSYICTGKALAILYRDRLPQKIAQLDITKGEDLQRLQKILAKEWRKKFIGLI